jgi:phosphohistidine phosphatase
MKHLLLCRHAKSSWKDGTLADFDRPLNKRGRQNAPEMGRKLRGRGVQPDLVVTSPALRALDTAKLLSRECGIPKKNILVLDNLYDSYPAKILEIIQGFDNRINTALIVGHNPEITIAANILGGLGIDNVPTGGIVALDFAVESWEEADEEGATLNFIDYPRKEEQGGQEG